MWQLMKAIAEMKRDHWTKDEIGGAAQSWFWVQVELMVW